MRSELRDKQWSIIATMLPTKPRGVPRVDGRRVVRASSGYCDPVLPGAIFQCYGQRSTCYDRFFCWRRAANLDGITQALTVGGDGTMQMIDSCADDRAHRCSASTSMRLASQPAVTKP